MDLWPPKIFPGHPRAFDFDHLHSKRANLLADFERETRFHRPGQKWLMGYALPPFQREVEWSVDQMIAFIRSAVLGFPLGNWCFNSAVDEDMEWIDGKEYFHATDQWLIDGQQRLTALDRFFNDEFPVLGHRWSEIQPPQRRRFLSNARFEAFEVRIPDETALAVLYNHMAFGGTPHRPEQRVEVDEVAVLQNAIAKAKGASRQVSSIPNTPNG